VTEVASGVERPLQSVPRSRRFDIQALRAVAVLAVVLNHVWPTRLVGGFFGVDVFFVISGFLITDQLLRELTLSGRVRLGPFWRRRARRLLPASLLAGATILAATFLVMPGVARAEAFRQVIASATYVENWVLAANSVDYFHSSAAPSPSMHYWSLSVEEQFYLVWPLFLLGTFVVANRMRRGLSVVVTALAVVTVVGFLLSAALTGSSPASYFNTGLRAFEFGLGGLWAAVRLLRAPSPVLPNRWRPFMAGIGWSAIVVSVIAIGSQYRVPGAVAVIPTVGTALVIAAELGTVVVRHPLARAIRSGIDWVGASSYSIYLWHWPLIVFFPIVFGTFGGVQRVAVLIVSLLMGGLSRRFVEDPVRRSAFFAPDRPRRYLVFVAATAVVVLVALGGIVQVDRAAYAASAVAAPTGCVGAAAMAPGSHCDDLHRITSPDAALAASRDLDNPLTDGSTCIQDRDVASIMTCGFGADPAHAAATVAVVGDSHAGHWIEAIDVVARAESWRVVLYLKSSCPAVLDRTVVADWYSAGAASCHDWSAAVNAQIAGDPSISTVFFSSLSRHYLATDQTAKVAPLSADAYRAAWRPWLRAGKRVVVLADLPDWHIGDVPTCVEQAGLDDPCSVPASAREGDPMVAAASRPAEGLSLIDLNDFLCDATRCHPVDGGLVAIGDANHMTSSFSRTLGPYLLAALKRSLIAG